MDPVLSALFSSPLLGGLGAFALAGSFVSIFYWLSVSGRIYTRSQHESIVTALTSSRDSAIKTLESQHAVVLDHFTKRNERLEGLFDAQQEVIKSQQHANDTKNDVIAQQTQQISELMVVTGTFNDFLTRVPRTEEVTVVGR